MKKGKKRRLLGSLACSGTAMCMSQQAYAQSEVAAAAPAAAAEVQSETSADDSGAGEIIVTAQKRSERLQDVPMSITAATGEELKSQGVTSTEQLGKIASGFTINKTTRGEPVFIIRGVGFNDGTAGASSTVAVYVDQLPIPFTVMARGTVLDLERVEVLKGPQGTLFGQNSTGGAVNFIAAKPTSDLRAGFDLTVGRFNQVELEGFVSGPISNTLSARIAVRNEYRGDWQKGYTVEQSLGERRFLNGRAIVDWKPSDRLTVELSASGWRDRSDSQQLQFVRFQPLNPNTVVRFPIRTFPAAPDDARAAAWDPGRDFSQDNYFYQFGSRVDYEMSDAISLTSLTAYGDYKQDIFVDFDATTFPAVVNNVTARIESFSQELRLAGEMSDGRLKWLVGGSYAKDHSRERYIQSPLFTSTNTPPFIFSGFIVDNDQKVETKAAFGGLDFNITDQLQVQGSVRYTDQDRDFTGCTRDLGDGTYGARQADLATRLTGRPQTIAPGACVTLSAAGVPLPIVTGVLNEDNISWRAGVNWKISNDNLVYANVTRGYKSGSFPTIPSVFEINTNPVGQESLLAYEAGIKMSALSRAVQITASGFYYDYKDKQLVGFVVVPGFGPIPSLVSIPKSSVRGAEIGATLYPVAGLTLTANGSYIDTRIDSNPAVPRGAFGNAANFVGEAFPNTPKWQSNFGADYRFAASGEMDAFFGLSGMYRSATSGLLRSGTPAVAALEDLVRIPSYTLFDVRAGIETSDRSLRVEAFVRNVADKFYLISASKASDYVTRYAGMPRTFGVTLSYRYR